MDTQKATLLDNDRIMNKAEVCELLGIAQRTLDRLRARQRNPLPHFFIGNQVRFRLSEIDQYCRSNPKGAEAGA